MRILVPLTAAVLLIACREQQPVEESSSAPARARPEQPGPITFAGAGRDRLCLNRQTGRAGFITYGTGNANCTVRGSIGTGNMIRPDGDSECSITFDATADTVELRSGGEACGYYCGPAAEFSNKAFRQTDEPVPVTDVAGDPLC